MRKFVIASALLVALVLITLPVVAAPATSSPRVAWRGSGVADTGDHVKFSGTAVQSGGLFWSGDGTFSDQDNSLRARMTIECAAGAPVDGRVELAGYADVSADGVRYRNCEVNLVLDQVARTYDIVIISQGGGRILGRYVVSGDDLFGSIQMT